MEAIMKRTITYEANFGSIEEAPYRNKDMKDFRANRNDAEEGAHLMRLVTYLMVAVAFAAIAWMTERDNHPFKDPIVEAKNDH